tara:strand:+ start:2165 stop:3949 length:1785 start_codon:yes stop_codon:yes gene_type:complete
MAYQNEPFIKEKDGVQAPNGFHYMPNGKLMSDADHIALYGYVEKTINNIIIDTKDVNYLGDSKAFTINGDEGAVFSLEIYDNSNNYYNFTTKSWSASKSGLNKISLINGTYKSQINFDPIGAGSLKTYTINLIAETVNNIKTSHVSFIEARFLDDTIDINNCEGSNSNILQKIIYQDVKKNLYLSCVAPSLYTTSIGVVNGAKSGAKIVIDQDATDQKIINVGDKVTGTGIAGSTHTLVRLINPDGDNVNEIEVDKVVTVSDGVNLTFTPGFNGVTPHFTDSTSGRHEIEISSSGYTKASFSITCTALSGRTFAVKATPTIDDLCAITTVNFESAALAIVDENTSSDSVFFRWPVDNIARLSEGMFLDSARTGTGLNTTHPAASISSYLTTQTKTEVVNNEYYKDIKEITIPNVSLAGVDTYGNDITAMDRTGVVTAQKGNIIFNKQQKDALKSDTNVRIFGYGAEKIKELTGVDVSISNIVVTPTQVSTTTATTTSASQTIRLTEVANVSPLSQIRGIGIDPTVASPTIKNKTAQSGEADIVVSSAQTIENGQTLFFDTASNIITITGEIEVTNMGISDTTLYFDLEKFLIVK